jgi:DNA primase
VFADNRFHCFGCGKYGDVIQFVLYVEPGISNAYDAARYLSNGDCIRDEPIKIVENSSYKGPVANIVVEGWHAQLLDRTYLHNRLINDETIDTNKIGWHVGKHAITIPFWSGMPGESEADSVQLRSLGPDGTYSGITGHYRKALLNRHILSNTDWAIILFGTFDALLALQDGFPAVSPNGINSWKEEWLELFVGVRRVIVVPDKNNERELEVAKELVAQFQDRGELIQFPDGDWGKDYTDFRLGHSIGDATQLLGWG